MSTTLLGILEAKTLANLLTKDLHPTEAIATIKMFGIDKMNNCEGRTSGETWGPVGSSGGLYRWSKKENDYIPVHNMVLIGRILDITYIHTYIPELFFWEVNIMLEFLRIKALST